MTNLFDKVFSTSIVILVLAVMVFGARAMYELNDGRVHTVVSQIVRGGAQ